MMRRIELTLLLLVVTLIGVGQAPRLLPAQPDAPAAVLTSCRGSVMVSRSGGQATMATFGLSLNDGDEVKTGADAEAEIMFAAGNWVTVGPNSSMRIKSSPGAKQPPKDAGSFEVVNNFLKLKSTEGTSSISGLRTADKASALLPMEPVQTKVMNTTPLFSRKIDDPALE
jgi:hypothetical protein